MPCMKKPNTTYWLSHFTRFIQNDCNRLQCQLVHSFILSPRRSLRNVFQPIIWPGSWSWHLNHICFIKFYCSLVSQNPPTDYNKSVWIGSSQGQVFTKKGVLQLYFRSNLWLKLKASFTNRTRLKSNFFKLQSRRIGMQIMSVV